MSYEFKYTDCNICGTKNRSFLGKRIPRSFSIGEQLVTHSVKCKGCGLIYPYPMPFADYEQQLKNYSNPETYFPAEISEERFKFYDAILKKIDGLIENKGNLLDIGCGRGELLYVAKNHGWQVCGVDISPVFAKYAKERFNVDIKVGDIKRLDFRPESFDVITLTAVLDHVYDPKGLVLELHRILKKNGIIFIEVMNNESILYKLGDLYYRLKGQKTTTNLSPTFPSFQVYGFSARTMSRLLQMAGFRILDIRIRGGISKTEKFVIKDLKERLLRTLRILCFIFADLLNKGQVLEVYAKKI